ncbi:hypothetical protein F2Q68_00042317 [Brassica cretica]|uniref:Uncharacterized protein n=1 Tax=Brassica cretica TaxID=69181 RepID=A0A8S9MEZ7_BRACR|nr:hypothetical protein F2Q68_00042317 [Brassica cretica]
MASTAANIVAAATARVTDYSGGSGPTLPAVSQASRTLQQLPPPPVLQNASPPREHVTPRRTLARRRIIPSPHIFAGAGSIQRLLSRTQPSAHRHRETMLLKHPLETCRGTDIPTPPQSLMVIKLSTTRFIPSLHALTTPTQISVTEYIDTADPLVKEPPPSR